MKIKIICFTWDTLSASHKMSNTCSDIDNAKCERETWDMITRESSLIFPKRVTSQMFIRDNLNDFIQIFQLIYLLHLKKQTNRMQSVSSATVRALRLGGKRKWLLPRIINAGSQAAYLTFTRVCRVQTTGIFFQLLKKNVHNLNFIAILNSAWKIHSNEYKHAQYWFGTSW